MPAAVVKAFAKKYGVDISTVERYWNEAKDEYGKDWAAVTETVKKRLSNHAKKRGR